MGGRACAPTDSLYGKQRSHALCSPASTVLRFQKKLASEAADWKGAIDSNHVKPTRIPARSSRLIGVSSHSLGHTHRSSSRQYFRITSKSPNPFSLSTSLSMALRACNAPSRQLPQNIDLPLQLFYQHTYIHIYIYTYIHIYIYTCIHVNMYEHMYTCMSTCVDVYMYVAWTFRVYLAIWCGLYSNCNKTTGSGLFKQQLMVVSGVSPTKTTAPRG